MGGWPRESESRSSGSTERHKGSQASQAQAHNGVPDHACKLAAKAADLTAGSERKAAAGSAAEDARHLCGQQAGPVAREWLDQC